jgi:DNA repair exonuclease SbcCD ATPase subunit
MSATEEAAPDTLGESEESPNEASTEAAPAQTKQESRLQVALPLASAAVTSGETNNPNTALAQGSGQAIGELPPTKARKAAQPKSNDRERTASTRLDHAQSLQAGRSSTGSFAQRECGELKCKPGAAQHEKSLLHKKVKPNKEKVSEVTGHLKTVREQKEALEATLFEKEEEFKQLLKRFRLAESEIKQCAIDQRSQERESSRLLEQIKDLKDENKRYLNQNNEFEKQYNACCTKLERKCEEASDSREQGKRYFRERNELQQQVVELKAHCDDLTLSNTTLKCQYQDAMDGQLKAEENERKFKDAARFWKNKHDRANQAKNDEIQKGTKLAEEISTLRHRNAVEDDHSLRDDMATLRYTVRDWCDRILECKPAGVHAHYSEFPLDNEGSTNLSNLGEGELNVLIASVWEWLIKLVFGCDKGRIENMGHPDLWLEHDKSVCLNSLEQYLRSKGKSHVCWFLSSDADIWRPCNCNTVALSYCPATRGCESSYRGPTFW